MSFFRSFHRFPLFSVTRTSLARARSTLSLVSSDTLVAAGTLAAAAAQASVVAAAAAAAAQAVQSVPAAVEAAAAIAAAASSVTENMLNQSYHSYFKNSKATAERQTVT